jgi:capsular exopolysaccharide synthesis family protein
MNRSGKRNQVVGITSTRPNEGKSTVAAALALLLAHAGTRVILVDCNLRNRSLSAELAPTAAFGILDVMTGVVSVSETTWTDSVSELAFLPVGNNSRSVYASAVLTSEKLRKLFQTLREVYEYVIVDLPAVAPFADVRAAAHLLDSFILVVEAGRTNIGVVEHALKLCSDMDEIMLGVTLNKADMKSLKGQEPRS